DEPLLEPVDPVPVPVLLAEPAPLAPLRGTMPGGHCAEAVEPPELDDELELLLVVPELVPAGTQLSDIEPLGEELLVEPPLGELEPLELDCARAGRAMIEARAAAAMSCFMREPLCVR